MHGWILQTACLFGFSLLLYACLHLLAKRPFSDGNWGPNPSGDPGFPEINFPPGTPVGAMLVDRPVGEDLSEISSVKGRTAYAAD